MLKEELNEILIALWRKGVKRPGPSHQLLVEETKHVAPLVAAMERDMSPYIQQRPAKEEDKLTFLLYHFTLYFQEGLSLLGEIPTSLGKVLSIGAPYAPYAIAAGALGAKEVTFLDADFFSLTVAGEIAGRLGVTLQGRKPQDPLSKESFDTVIIDHLSPTPEEIDRLSSLLKPNGYIVWVEGASREQNKAFLERRDQLVERGYAVQAPCVWKGECPGRTFNFPCFAQRALEKTFVMKEIQKRAEIEQNSLKMSYLILKKRKTEWPKCPKTPAYRVVSSVLKGPSGNRFLLCGTDGKKRLNLVQTSYPKEARALSFLKRGELIYIEDELRKGDDLFAGPGTKAEVLAPLGKPLSTDEYE